MEPHKRYTQTVKRAFHVSMAALDITNSDNEPTQVLCMSEDRNYLLCTLQKDKVMQCPLELTFEVIFVCESVNNNTDVILCDLGWR